MTITHLADIQQGPNFGQVSSGKVALAHETVLLVPEEVQGVEAGLHPDDPDLPRGQVSGDLPQALLSRLARLGQDLEEAMM